jgi:hypothetical protein
MKYLFTFFTLLLVLQLEAQTIKKYALVEHFTNTRCGSCAASNPGFFNNIQVTTNTNLHHISFHSRVPYNSCLLYTANPVPQDNRATKFYSIFGTPVASVNGAAPVSINSISAATITNASSGSASLYFKVENSTSGTPEAKVKLTTLQNIPAGKYKLYVALVEKVLNYSAPNGEKVHHNVFRSFLTAEGGEDVAALASNGSLDRKYNYTLNSNWVANQMYVLAWVQDVTSKDVPNSGTNFDSPSSSNDIPVLNEALSISPNPTTDFIDISLVNLNPKELSLMNSSGQILKNINFENGNNLRLEVKDIPRGIYFLHVKSTEGISTKRFIKL